MPELNKFAFKDAMKDGGCLMLMIATALFIILMVATITAYLME